MNNINKIEELVTVIITTYQRPPEMVKRAIKSVVEQTYKNLEIIIVDDSPCTFELRSKVTDMILNIKDNRIKYLQNEKNIGACASRNRAIKESKGKFIIYVDDDDELLPKCIEKRISGFISKKIGLVYSDCIFIDELKNKEFISNQKKLKGYVFDKLIIENFILAFPMLRRECFDICGLFNETLPASQDWDMWLRVSKKYEINYINEPLSKIYLHKYERISTSPYKKIIGLLKIYDLNKEYILNNPYINYIKKKELIPYYINAGDIKKGWFTFLEIVKLKPYNFKDNLFSLLLAIFGTYKKVVKRKRI